MPEGVLLDPASALVDRVVAEFHDVESIEHGDGVLEVIVNGVLVTVERVEGSHLDPLAERLATLDQPVRVRLSRPARHQIEQPGADASVLVTGQIDHPGELVGAAAALAGWLGRGVVPHKLIDPEIADLVEPRVVTGPSPPAAA